MRQISKIVQLWVPGRRAGHSKGPMTEHRTTVSRHKQLTAASGPQVLPTSNVRGLVAAVFHVPCCLVLQTDLSSNQSTPVTNESGAITQLWWTPEEITNHRLNWLPTQTQLVERSRRHWITEIIFRRMPHLATRSHKAGQLRESNAARRSM